MSYSPSYSPVLDIANSQNIQNITEDSNPITNPFYYAQDRDSWYIEEAARLCEESRQKKTEERKLKKKKMKSFKNTSFIMRKERGHPHHLIKIMVYNLDGCNGKVEEIDAETDNADINVQYIVTSDYDDIMDETDSLVSKIVQKLSKSNASSSF